MACSIAATASSCRPSERRLFALCSQKSQRSGSRDLDRAAVNAVRQWRFQPAQRDGQAVAGAVTVPIDFKMR